MHSHSYFKVLYAFCAHLHNQETVSIVTLKQTHETGTRRRIEGQKASPPEHSLGRLPAPSLGVALFTPASVDHQLFRVYRYDVIAAPSLVRRAQCTCTHWSASSWGDGAACHRLGFKATLPHLRLFHTTRPLNKRTLYMHFDFMAAVT